MNCYICGHPILEGQKWEQRTFSTWEEGDGWKKVGKRPVRHMNSADHLPTLNRTGVFVEVEKQSEFLAGRIRKERERAAKLVEEAIERLSAKDGGDEITEEWNSGWDSAIEWLPDLAQRIRDGGE